jgi:pilus assembly protein Flp/PilA
MIRIAARFIANDSGATAIEYGLLTALIAVFLIAALQNLGTRMSNEFSEIGNAIK